MPPLGFILCFGTLSVVFLGVGALLAFDPGLYVQVHRRVFRDDYSRSVEWEQKMSGMEARVCGLVFFCVGLGGFYLLLKTMKFL
jgi:hypothetical protein